MECFLRGVLSRLAGFMSDSRAVLAGFGAGAATEEFEEVEATERFLDMLEGSIANPLMRQPSGRVVRRV